MVLTFEFYESGLREPSICCCVNWTHLCKLLRYPYLSRFRLLSLPGGHAFSYHEAKLGRDLRTVWLGQDANCHNTDPQHPFEVALCPLSRDRDCWQCLYMLQVQLTVRQGDIPVAATTNLRNRRFEAEYGPGSSELPSECFATPVPEGWGQASFSDAFLGLRGCCRMAQPHQDTGEPLGLGCRWERQYLDSLPQRVVVVARAPKPSALVGVSLHLASLQHLVLGFVAVAIIGLGALHLGEEVAAVVMEITFINTYLAPYLSLFSGRTRCCLQWLLVCTPAVSFVLIWRLVCVGVLDTSTGADTFWMCQLLTVVLMAWVEMRKKCCNVQMEPLRSNTEYLQRGSGRQTEDCRRAVHVCDQ